MSHLSRSRCHIWLKASSVSFHLIPSMHVHVVVWAFSSSCLSTSSSSLSSTSSWFLPWCLTRIPWKIPCATPPSGAWSAWTMSHPTQSCSPTIVMTANGEVQTHEEATVCVKELDISLTMKVLENTTAVLSLGKAFAMKTDIPMNRSMVKNHLSSKTGFGYLAIRRNFVSVVVPGLSSSSSLQFSSFNLSDTFKTVV